MTDDVTCGHCRRPIATAARGWAADKTVLCHTGTLPPVGYPPDCFRLAVIYGHATDGSCCPELAAASALAERMADRAGHAALLRDAAEILQARGHPGDTLLAATLRCAADAFPWEYGVMPTDVDDVMTGLVRTADEIVQRAQMEGGGDD